MKEREKRLESSTINNHKSMITSTVSTRIIRDTYDACKGDCAAIYERCKSPWREKLILIHN